MSGRLARGEGMEPFDSRLDDHELDAALRAEFAVAALLAGPGAEGPTADDVLAAFEHEGPPWVLVGATSVAAALCFGALAYAWEPATWPMLADATVPSPAVMASFGAALVVAGLFVLDRGLPRWAHRWGASS